MPKNCWPARLTRSRSFSPKPRHGYQSAIGRGRRVVLLAQPRRGRRGGTRPDAAVFVGGQPGGGTGGGPKSASWTLPTTTSRTGCELHPNYWPAKLRWLQQTQAAEFGKAVTRWMSFAEYFSLRLFGAAKVSLSMASGTGLLNPNTKTWDPETLKVLPVTEGQP